MSNALITQILNAEKEADEIRLNAQHEANALIASAEEAFSEDSRRFEKELSEIAAHCVEESKLGIEDELKALEVRKSAEHTALNERAEERVETVARLILREIMSNGSR